MKSIFPPRTLRNQSISVIALMLVLAGRVGGVSAADTATASSAATATPDEAVSSEEDSESTADVLAGHSVHGDAYSEGPRQDAYLMGGTGSVQFPITTDSELAQQYFNQGIGQLHGFWYYEAERSFRRVRALDPECAMASWGMAMANLLQKERARKFIAEAVERKSQGSEREQSYIDAVAAFLKEDDRKDKDRYSALLKALDKIVRKYPDDVEAKAMLALWMWQSDRHGVPIASHIAVDSILGDVFEENPHHPAHHYRIHLWDREDPAQALASAAQCGQAAPAIAHLWHMPGHIYSRLKRYGDAAWQQEASARADHAYMVRDRVMPDQIFNYAHNNEWLIRNLVFTGRVDDALSLARNMLELPRHPEYNSFDRKSKDSCKYGRERLFEVLETYNLWQEVVALAETMYLEPTQQLDERARRLRLLMVAHHHLGNWHGFADCQEKLNELTAEVETLAAAAGERKAVEIGLPPCPAIDASGRSRREKQRAAVEKQVATAQQKVRDRHRVVAEATQEAEGLACLARGDTDAAAEKLRDCRGIPELRRAEYAFRWGGHDKALEIVEKEVKQGEHEVPPLAVQVDLLRRMGNREQAVAAFKRLRGVAGSADLDRGLLARLAPLAADLGWPEDWREPPSPATDIGNRPDLNALGPFRWTPPQAEAFDLPDAFEVRASLDEHHGRPIVLLFYLGSGCLHCAEQLQQFAAHVDKFDAIDIELLAISTDPRGDLASSIENFSEEGKFAIRLLSDFQLDVFKRYRCFDDFESSPLHGTFLIDGKGRIRWQDISYQPFEDVEFLLEECERLLSID